MDTSGLSSGIVLLVALAFFAYFSAAEGRYHSGQSGRGSGETVTGTPPLLWVLMAGSMLAVFLSSIALFLSFAPVRWTLVSLWGLGTLVLLWATRHIILLLTRHGQGTLFPFITPVARGMSKAGWGAQRESLANQVNGEDTHLDVQQEPSIQPELSGELDERERGMIRSILHLDQVTAREIMVPRMDIVAVDVATPLHEVAELMVERGYSKLPVYRDTIDDIVGTIHARDLLEVLAKGSKDVPLEGLVRPALFVPESKPVAELLQELQEKRIQLAQVVDEYGGIEGLVTMEDVLEEIVGEIEDEFSHDEPRLVVISEHEAMVDSRINLDDVNEALGTRLNVQNVDTIGGLVSSILDRIARIGDEIEVGGLRITVVSTRGRRIRQLRITRLEEVEGSPEQTVE